MDALPGTWKHRADAFKPRTNPATGHGNIQ